MKVTYTHTTVQFALMQNKCTTFPCQSEINLVQPRNLHPKIPCALSLGLSKQQNVTVCVQCIKTNTNTMFVCATIINCAN